VKACWLIAMGILVGAGCASSRRSAAPSPAVAPADANSSNDSALNEIEEDLAQKQKKTTVADPLEPVNRFMFGVNDVLYFWVAKPVLTGYVKVVPQPVRGGIRNFFHNLATPTRLVNCILQNNASGANAEVSRFAINTTIGVLGIGDPAHEHWKLQPAEEDLGQTLAYYGLGDGFYLMWPLLGPSNLRDSVGMVGDEFLNPTRYITPEELSIGVSATSTVNSGSFHLGDYETLKAASVDPYVAMREAYVQYRHKQIKGEGDPKREASRLGTEDRPTDPNHGKP
jgi:phospholipid-binding lipoprotein MlaA